MPMEENLRSRLVQYIRRKFKSFPNVAVLADDIVNEAYALLLGSKSYSPDKENFGYLSMTCIRVAYRIFMSDRSGCESLSDYEGASSMLVGEDNFVDELARDIDMKAVLDSLAVLRDVERIVITERYYNDFTFAEIAKKHGIKLNTVLSHHRRALEKLRPELTRLMYFDDESRYYEKMKTGYEGFTKHFY